MKVDERKLIGIAERDMRDNKRRMGTVTSDFNNTLKEYEQSNVYEYLTDLRFKIEKQGEKLSKSVNINDLKYYKKMISDFLQQALSESLAFEKESVSDRRGRRHIYSLVKKINKRVDELVKQVMEKEKNHIEILKAIDDIRGMLIDLMM